MKANYVYPAKITKTDDVFEITFPDFDDATTCAYSEEELIKTAQDFLALLVLDYEQEDRYLPRVTLNMEGAVYIHVWIPYFRSKVKEVYVKKTLTIPEWLDILAKKNDINFSATLVKALKEELNLK